MRIAFVLFCLFISAPRAEAQTFATRVVAAREASFHQGLGFGIPSLAGPRVSAPTAFGAPSGFATTMGTTVGSTVGSQTGTVVGTQTGP
jgi:hypothetical protein